MRTRILVGTLSALAAAHSTAHAASLSIGDAWQSTGAPTASLVVGLSESVPGRNVTVNYTTTACTAFAGVDYTQQSNQLTFTPGQMYQQVDIPLNTAPGVGTREFRVVLSNPINATLATSSGRVWVRHALGARVPARGDYAGNGNAPDGRSDLVFHEIIACPGNPCRPADRDRTCPTSGTGACPGQNFTSALYTPNGWSLLTPGDFDGNGGRDTLWQYDGSFELATRLAGQVQVETPPVQPPATFDPNAPAFFGTGDFNGDGRADLAMWNAATRTVSFAVAPGTPPPDHAHPFPLPVVGAVGSTPIGTADLSGDGLPDLLWRNDSSGQFRLQVLSVGGAGPAFADQAMQPTLLAGQFWKLAAWGDFDGNGTEDLVWQNSASTKMVVWLMDRNVRICGDYLSPDSWPGELIGPR